MDLENYQKLYHRLFSDNWVKIHLGGSDIDVYLVDHNDKMKLIASVYEGGNYIPHSVRKCIQEKISFEAQWMQTRLIIEEDKFQVFLIYVGQGDAFNPRNFKNLLEEFSWQADEWRLYLEEHDNNDLVPIYNR